MWFTKFQDISIEKKIVIMFLGLMIAGIVVSAGVMGYFLDKTRTKTYDQVARSLNMIMKEKHKALETVAYTNMLSIAANQELADALKNGNRQKAIEILAKIEKNIEQNSLFHTFKVHLHDSHGHAFLRSWKPGKYGDDLTTFRNTIPYMVANHKPFVTTEVGKTGMTIRGIVPMFDQERHYVGSGEYIVSFDSFIDWMKKNEDADLLVLLDKKYQIKRKPDDIALGHYVLSQKKYNPEFLKRAQALHIDALQKQPFFTDDHYLYTLVPIVDFAGKKIGYYLIGKEMQSVNALLADAYKMIYASLAVMALLLLSVTGISIFVLRKLVFSPLKDFQAGLMDFFTFFQKRSGHIAPICVHHHDEIGEMALRVNDEISRLEKSITNEEKVISEAVEVIEKASSGDLTRRVEVTAENATIQKMLDLLNNLFQNLEENIGKDINKIVHTLESYAHCDYTQAIPDATGRIEKTLNRMQEVITQMLILNVQSSEALESSSRILSHNVVALNRSAETQFESIENTFGLVTQINENMKTGMQKLKNIEMEISTLTLSLQQGEQLSLQTGDSMEAIDTQVEDIMSAIKIIDEIAFQTNILSLNAAVEAATAGDAGKGFAVVAQEVRNLAAKSADAARSIKTQVENATELTQLGKNSSGEMLTGYRKLKEKIEQTTAGIQEIAEMIKAQNHYIVQINAAMQQIRQSAQNNRTIAAKTEEISKDTQSLSADIVHQAQKSKYDITLTVTEGCSVSER